MATQEDMQALKEKLSYLFLQQDRDAGVAGVGIGKDEQGRATLTVHLDGRNPAARALVLSHTEGFPVQFVEQGPIRKFSANS
jgi:hypothetical protein